MAEPIVIDVILQAKNQTQDGIKKASKGLEQVGKEAQSARDKLSGFEKTAQKMERSLRDAAKERYEILLEAKERVTPMLDRISSGLRGVSGRAWSVTMRTVDLATAPVRGLMNLLRNPIFQAGAVLGVSVGVGDTINTYKDFEAAMSQVKAISGADEEEFGKLAAKAKEMGATTKFTATEAAEGFNYMAMAGWKTKDMLGGIEGIMSLAAASGESLGTTSDIVTDALTAFGLKASDSRHFADVLSQAAANANTNVGLMGETFKYVGTMAGALGYGIEDVSLAVGLMANSGLKGSMAGTSLNAIMTRLATNTNGAADAINDLGVAFFKKDGSARDLKLVMDELRDATRGMNDEQKSGLAKTVAGMEAQKGLLAILNATTEDYDKLSKAVYHADGASKRMSDTMMDNLQGSIELLQSAVDEVKLSAGERMKPYIKEFAEWLTEMMPNIDAAISHFLDEADQKIKAFRGRIRSLTQSRMWESADFFGKVNIAWDELIANPFIEWWNSEGKQKVSGLAGDMGDFIGSGFNQGLMALLGVNDDGLLEGGLSAGASFAKGFMEGFEPEKVRKAIMEAVKGIISDSYFGGGNSGTSPLSTMLVGAVGLKGLGAGVKIGKGLYDTYSAGKILTGLLKPGMVAEAASGVPAVPEVLAATGGVSMSVLASVAGGVLAAMGLNASIRDLKRAQSSSLSWDRDRYTRQGVTKGSLVAAGAGIGTLIAPGVGTLVGAGIGGAAAMFGGNAISELFKSERERAHESLMQMGDDLKEAVANFEETTSRTEIAKGLIDEYKGLKDFMNSSDFDHTKAEEVQGRMKDILEQLGTVIDPGLLSKYERLNGMSDKRIEGLDRELQRMDEQERRHLKQTVMDTQGQIPQMMKDYDEVTTAIKERQEEWENMMAYREGLKDIKQRYDQYGDEGNTRMQEALLKQAETLSAQRGFKQHFQGYPVMLDEELIKSGSQSQSLLSGIDDLMAQQVAMDEQLQAYYDASVNLIEYDTGAKIADQQEKLDSLREAYDFMESHHGAMGEDMRQMVEEYLPGFSEIGGAAEQIDAIAQAIGDTKEQMQPALEMIKDLNDTLGRLPSEKKINITVGFSGLELPRKGFTAPEPSKHARGGFTSGAELSWIGEDGLEAVIPLSGKYRRRGLELYEAAGRYLGVGRNAEGGVYGAGISRAQTEPVSGGITATGNSVVVQFSSSPQTEIHVDASKGVSEADIMETLRQGITSMTDNLLADMARKVMLVFENMP